MAGGHVVIDLAGANVLVLGAGVSGPGAVRVLGALGARVVVADSRPEALAELTSAVPDTTGIDLDAAGERLATGSVDLVVTSPGWRPDSPLLVAAADAGIDVWGDVELAWHADRSGRFGEPRTWLAVTGTNGKTTCTSMLEAMCRAGGLSALACGNIGTAITEALLAEPRVDVLCIELSSFQLHWAPSVRPDAGVVLNIADDHLDWHGSAEAYAQAKAGVLTGRVGVADADDEVASRLLAESAAEQKVGFSVREPAAGELGISSGMLVDRAFSDPAAEILSAAEVRPAGPAGQADALGAAALARAAGVGPEDIARALREFRPGAHRCEVVAEVGGVTYIDDSKATNPHAARSSLLVGGKVVWIAGGLLKGADVDPLVAEAAPVLRGVVLIGRDREIIRSSLARHATLVPIVTLPSGDDGAAMDPEESQRTMDQAVAEASALAQPGDTVLLAPSAASMDMFQNYARRGESFAAAVATVTRS